MREFASTWLLALAFFLIIGAHYLFKASCGAMLVERYGASGVPRADLLEAALALLVVVPILASSRLRLRLSAILGGAAALALVTLVIAPMVARDSASFDISLFAAFLAGSVLISLSVYTVWMLLTVTVQERKGLHFTIFGVGAQIAVILSSFGIDALLEYTSPPRLLWLAALGYAASWTILLAALRRFRCVAGHSPEMAALRLEEGRSLGLDALLAVWRSPYLRLMSSVVILHAAFGQAMRWRVYEQASASETLSQAASMLTVYYRYTGMASLAAQLLIVPLVFRYVQVRRGMLVQPLVGLMSLALVLHGQSAEAIFAAIAVFTSIDYTVNNSMREALFLPLPAHVKVHIKSVVAMVIPKVGALIAAGLVLMMGTNHMELWSLTLVILSILWIVAVVPLLSQYRRISGTVTLETYESVDSVSSSSDPGSRHS